MNRFLAWMERHSNLLKRIRKVYILLIWLLLPIAILIWLIYPVSRTMITILFWSYYALWQFWMLSRSKTIPWSHYARFFMIGIWIIGPLCLLIVWSIHFLFANGFESISDPWSMRVVGPIIEELIKLSPLLLFLFITGKEKQLSLVDYALIGAAVGTGFQFMEEVFRAWVTSRQTLLSMIADIFSQSEKRWGFGTLFPGYFQNGSIIAVGHHVWTAFVSLGIGFALQYRKKLGNVIWLIPTFLLAWVTFDHIAYNSQTNPFNKPFLIELAHFFTGQGHYLKWLFVAILLVAVYLDYKNLNKIKTSLPLLPNERFLEPLTEVLELVRSFFKGPKKWATTMLFFRERRAFGFATLFKQPENKILELHKNMQSAYKILGFALLFLAICINFSHTDVENMKYLAGVLDGVSDWWNSLSGLEKTGIILTTGLTVGLFMVATGGGIIAAGFTGFGSAMMTKDVLDSSGTIAGVIKDPKQLLQRAKNMSPQELLITGGLSLLEAAAKRFPVTRAFDEAISGLQKKSQGLGKKAGIDGGGKDTRHDSSRTGQDRDGVDGGSEGIDKTVYPNDVVPYRPSNSPLENHHGVMDVWAKFNIPNYVSRGGNTPTVALTKEQHAATKAVYREWLYEKTGKKVGGKIDWQSVSPREIQELTERMFDAANVPKSARQEYYNSFNKYNYRE